MANIQAHKYNLKSPGVKRLMREAIELAEPTEEYYASPLDDNLFEWHFTVRGPKDTEFEGGYYHGRILLPTQYPMQPPNIILLTPNGRFETNKKICLSISGYHPESWQPSWSIRTALLALIAFMPTSSAGTIGSLDYTPEERKVLAKKSINWECDICGKVADKLINLKSTSSAPLSTEESNLIQQIALKAEEESKKESTPSLTIGDPDSSETDIVTDMNTLRQRLAAAMADTTNPTPEAIVNDVILEASIERSNKDKLWSAVIWTLISMITVLIIRRFFFL